MGFLYHLVPTTLALLISGMSLCASASAPPHVQTYASSDCSESRETLVHTRRLLDTGYQAQLKPIKDIQIGDEVLAWDELKAHDNLSLIQFRIPPCQTSCRPIMIAEHPHRIDIYEQKFVFN